MSRYILGIDPGKSGAVAVMTLGGRLMDICEFSKHSEHGVADFIRTVSTNTDHSFIEAVSSAPRDGRRSAFTFGTNYGFYRGVMCALEMRFETIAPVKWQRVLGCLTHGDKKISREKARELFPAAKATHGTADAILIAEYGRRFFNRYFQKEDQLKQDLNLETHKKNASVTVEGPPWA